MSHLPIAFLALFFLAILFIVKKRRYDETVRRIADLEKNHSGQTVLRKNRVRCEANTIGRRTSAFKFSICDLIFLEDALAIVGYNEIGKRRWYANFVMLKNGNAAGYGKIKKVNFNSFGNDVYIEFGDAGFSSTNIEIRLKNLSDAEKNLIRIQ